MEAGQGDADAGDRHEGAQGLPARRSRPLTLQGLITDIKIRRNDTECVSASTDGTCIIWDLTRFVRNQILFANTVFRQVSYRPDEAQLLTVGTDRKAGYWEAFDGSLIREVEVSASGAVNAMDLAADGSCFVTGGDDRLVKVC